MSKNVVAALLLLALLIPAPLFAADTDQPTAESPDVVLDASDSEEENVNIHALPPILDRDFRHRKKNQFEININGGAYLGNSIGQTWVAGTKMTYWLNNTVGLGIIYSYSKLLTNRGSPFGSVITDSNMHAMAGQVVISQAAALRTGLKVMELDFYAMIGMGAMRLNRQWEPMGEIGGGCKFYTGVPWLAFRIDVDNYVHNTVQPGKNSIDFDVMITGGVSFLFPSRPSPYEKK